MQTINYKFVARVVGKTCIVEGWVMGLIIAVALYYGESVWAYLYSSISYFALGAVLSLYGRVDCLYRRIGMREGMLSVTLTWLLLSAVGIVPMMVTGATSSWVDAFFETISGFTTTGATIFGHLEHLPRALLLWRSLTQWQGGVGIVVLSLALLPKLGSGASHLFNAESTGITHERFLPRISDMSKRIGSVYLVETFVLTLLLWVGPMDFFDSICHAFTCISTGGYSVRDGGIGDYHSSYVEYVLSIFMYIGSLNLTLVYFAFTGSFRALWRDEETRAFTYFILLMTLVTAVWLGYHGMYASWEECFRYALFQIVSLGSSTGYLTADISLWKPFFWFLALLVMFVNGCAGSTSGGLKMSRFVVLIKNLYNEFRKRLHPHLVTPVLINGRQLSISVVHQIVAFCFLYLILIFVGSMLLTLDGMGFISSISLSTASLSNSGPGIGEYVSQVSGAGDFSKLVLCFLMLTGRLEVFTVLGIFTASFWKG